MPNVSPGLPVVDAVREGAREMVVPVLYAVGTNIIAFIPLIFVPGATGQFMRHLPIVASVVFFVSLVEALLVLPAHLNEPAGGRPGLLARLTRHFRRTTRFHGRGSSTRSIACATAPYLKLLRPGTA